MSRLFRWIAISAIFVALALVSSSFWLPAIGHYLVKAEQPVRAEVIVVLAGDGFGNRILKGAKLVRQGFAPMVFVSGPTGHYQITEDELAINFAVKRGYSREYFTGVPNDARSTREEAVRG